MRDVVEKLSPENGHWKDPNPCIAQKWSGKDDELKIVWFDFNAFFFSFRTHLWISYSARSDVLQLQIVYL